MSSLTKEHAMITIIFSIMTLESFINKYLLDNSSDAFYNNYLKRLSLKQKWVLSTRLSAGKEFNIESKAYGLFCKLLKLRHDLVHNNPKITKKGNIKLIDIGVNERIAKLSIKTVIEMLKELHEIDISWLGKPEPFMFQ